MDSIVSSRLLVCERTGKWAVALAGELADDAEDIHQTRSLEECWEALARCPASLAVLELTKANAEALIRRLADLDRRFPQARAIVVAARSLAAYENLAREAGAIHFETSPRRLGAVAATWRRHRDALPERKMNTPARILAGLPWGS
ncbi:MAG: hypothetical protein ACYC35_01600 [Pirellulales bacterium]